MAHRKRAPDDIRPPKAGGGPSGRRGAAAGRTQYEQGTTSKSGILDALKDEEESLRTQLVAIQRAIEAIELADAGGPSGRREKRSAKVLVQRKRAMTEEQRQAIAERMRRYWASRRVTKVRE